MNVVMAMVRLSERIANRAKPVFALALAVWLLCPLGGGLGYAQVQTLAQTQAPVPSAPLATDAAKASPEPVLVQFETEQPEGFDDLLSPRHTTLDLYVDGQNLGPVDVLINPETVRFVNPELVYTKLPPIRMPAEVMAKLKSPLRANAGLSCSPTPVAGCGRLDPEIIGVIVSRDVRRLDLFLNAQLRGETSQHLRDPETTAPSLVGAIGLQFSVNADRFGFTVQPRSVIGFGRGSLSTEATFSNRQNSLDRAYYRYVGKDTALSIGLISSSSFNFVYFDRLVGLSYASSNDTRIQQGGISDTPIIIDTPLQGRVEIIRDGVLLGTQRVGAGRIMIDTSSLPSGAYPIGLKIIDSTGERIETRFFARAPGLPAFGETQFFIEGGWNTAFRSRSTQFVPTLLSPDLRAGVNIRAGPQLGLSARTQVNTKRQLIELSATYLNQSWRTSATIGVANNAHLAMAFTASGSRKQFNWSVDARHIQGFRASNPDPELGIGPSYQQVSSFVGYSHKALSLNSGVIWRKESSGQSSLMVLPSLRYVIAQDKGRRLEIETSGSLSRASWSARIGLRVSLSHSHGNSAYGYGTEHNNQGQKSFGNVDWSQSRDAPIGPIQMRAGLNQQNEQLTGRAGLSLTTIYSQISADTQLEPELSRSSLYGRIDTGFGLNDKGIAFGSGAFSGAGIAVKALGAEPDAKFTLRALGSNSSPITGSKTVFVPVAPFSQGEVGINTLGGSHSFDTHNEPAVFYPGTVKRLERRSKHIVVIYAQLVDSQGHPIGMAIVQTPDSYAETDENGFFQIEVDSQASLQAKRDEKPLCTLKLPVFDTRASFVKLGKLICYDNNKLLEGQDLFIAVNPFDRHLDTLSIIRKLDDEVLTRIEPLNIWQFDASLSLSAVPDFADHSKTVPAVMKRKTMRRPLPRNNRTRVRGPLNHQSIVGNQEGDSGLSGFDLTRSRCDLNTPNPVDCTCRIDRNKPYPTPLTCLENEPQRCNQKTYSRWVRVKSKPFVTFTWCHHFARLRCNKAELLVGVCDRDNGF